MFDRCNKMMNLLAIGFLSTVRREQDHPESSRTAAGNDPNKGMARKLRKGAVTLQFFVQLVSQRIACQVARNIAQAFTLGNGLV